MTPVFVDTSGWTACADAADPDHQRCMHARDGVLKLGGQLITSDYVVDETLTLLRLRLGLASAETWYRQINDSRRLRWERIDASRFDRAREWFFRHRDKQYSFTDCTSFVIMRELRVMKAIATDHHFEQAGFTLELGGRARSHRSRHK